MSTRPTPAPPSRLQMVATAMASSVFLLPLVLGKLFELVLKSINPDDIDVTVPLAYLRQLLAVSFSLLALWLVATVAATVVLHRREGSTAARLVWVVLGVQVALGLVYLLLQGTLNGINDGAS
ncbi:MAG: hypothetical protein Q4P15_00435 [Propionibacteriaceae bacterium]|nr:hypothetical protein [Propionibacteriaceae bacterium]